MSSSFPWSTIVYCEVGLITSQNELYNILQDNNTMCGSGSFQVRGIMNLTFVVYQTVGGLESLNKL
jgi:hypothetical protein